ncbi:MULTISPECIES: Hsp33 family molecular chaperone HslO [unclassified Acinetobacter]|uniref:Hsp33 family molecular chaperone HslO n=1 Tax=unclassified Acinetobacter TaxID=196816 RepID=UPI0035BA31D6
MNDFNDVRQRFYIHEQPVRGEVVQLEQTLNTILKQRDYPQAIQILLGEMLVATSLLASTMKIDGRISLQIQSSGDLRWAMAECNQDGDLRALAEFNPSEQFNHATDSSTALKSLQGGVLFINIEPTFGERYQGIIPLEHDTLAKCLMQYYDLSAQIPTHIVLATNTQRAGGLLLQLLPRTAEEQQHIDEDLWPRLRMLADTLKAHELTDLDSNEILYRLYHEEELRLPEAEALQFGCTCSRERCENALLQIGEQAVHDTLMEQNPIEMDCQFCNQRYSFTAEQALALFGQRVH